MSKLLIVLIFSLPSFLLAITCRQAAINAITEATPLKIVLKEGTEVEIEFLGLSAKQLKDSDLVDALVVQVKEVEAFLNELGADYPDGKCPICAVHIRPGTTMDLARGRQLLWHGGNKITVKMPVTTLFGNRPADSDVLRVHWNRGSHHSTTSIVSKRWEFLNPAGPLRLGLRRTMNRVLEKLKDRFSGLATRLEGAADGLATEIRALILESVGDASALSAGSRGVLDRLATMSVGEQKQLLLALTAKLGESGAVENVESKLESAVTSPDDEAPEPSWSIALSLGVSVSNAHDIQVRVSVVNGGLKSETVKNPLRTLSIGLLVAVATSDRVEIELGYERVAPTLAIEGALQQFHAN